MLADAEFPEKLAFLFDASRYKVAYGGRGSGKSWGVARALLIRAAENEERWLCCREFQKSTAESVHALLSDQVSALGLDGFYDVQQTRIVGANGSEFIFAGLRHNVANIKSIERLTGAWVEEAQTVSKASWDTLIPTVRADGSEIWITFNPELAEDETYQRFVVRPPPNAVVVKVNWSDNPWFPAVLRAEMEHLKATDPDAYLTVWEGHTRQTLDGAIYANEMRAATEAGRITKVPYHPSKPVHTFWDLGWADQTSIWFAQTVGFETRVIDFYQSQQQPLSHYLKAIQDRPYVLGACWLPHDARAKQLGTGKSVEELMRAAGREVRITPSLSIEDGINAARTSFATCWFDAERCADGLNALRRYRYEVDVVTGQRSRKPLHDDTSHAADAFRYLAVAMKEPRKLRVKPKLATPAAGPGAWMA